MNNKKISHVEIYYADSSMERISNEDAKIVNFTIKQLTWIKRCALIVLNDSRICYEKKGNVTLKNYRTFKEKDFSEIPHSEYQTILSLLDVLSSKK